MIGSRPTEINPRGAAWRKKPGQRRGPAHPEGSVSEREGCATVQPFPRRTMERPMADPTTPPAPPTAPIPESGQSRGYPPGGRSVEAGRGVAWWTAAWRLFAASPWIFIAMIVVFIVLTVTLALIPVAGSVATTVLAPVFAGGVFAGCRALDRGGELTIGHLFAGFADRLGPLVVVG